MHRTFPWFQGEGFDLLIEDLQSLPADVVVLVEGFRLLPRLVAPHVSDPRHAAWLLPSPDFRQEAFGAREEAQAFWAPTSEPERALGNLLARDEIFTESVAEDATRRGLRTLIVPHRCSLDGTADVLAEYFGLHR